MTFGFIGLGDMGLVMARRLLHEGHDVVVWNRSKEKVDLLASEGAVPASTPKQVLETAAVVAICLSDHDVVRSICEGEGGLFAADSDTQQDRVVVDFSTGAPETAVELARMAKKNGIYWLDAPVSGGVPAAQEGRLVVFVGGDLEGLKIACPMLDVLATAVHHLGPSGSGQTVKLCNQLIVSCNLMAIAEALKIAERAGVDAPCLSAWLKGGFADSLPLQIFGPRMARREFEPRLGSLALMAKDVDLTSKLAGDAVYPLLELMRRSYEMALNTDGIDPEGDVSQIVQMLS